MAKIQKELVLTNITFEVLSGESGKLIYPDPLEQTVIADGSYHVRLGALTNAQVKELFALCNPVGIHASEITGVGDSYRTVIVGLSIESKHPGVVFVIPDRTQNPYVTIKLSHIPGTDWIDLVSIKPYTSSEDEFMYKMRLIIDELKEFADKTETPVVTAEQPEISDRVTLHGVIINKVTRPDDMVVDFTFDNVSDEDLDALTKLYEEHPLIKMPSERHQMTSLPHGDKHLVTLGIFTNGPGYKSYLPRNTPIDITIELRRGCINPMIYDVTLDDVTPAEDKQLSDSKVNPNTKKEEKEMSAVSVKIEKAVEKIIEEASAMKFPHFSTSKDGVKLVTLPVETYRVITNTQYGMAVNVVKDRSTEIRNAYWNADDGTATIIWGDGSKTIARTMKGTTPDPEIGFAICIAKKVMGGTQNKWRKWLKSVVDASAASTKKKGDKSRIKLEKQARARWFEQQILDPTPDQIETMIRKIKAENAAASEQKKPAQKKPGRKKSTK